MITRRALLRLAAVAPLSSGPPAVVGAFGDSLTRDPASYAYVLAGAQGWQVGMHAINGSTLAQQATAWLMAPHGPTLAIVGYNDMRRHGHDGATLDAWRALLVGVLCWRVGGGPCLIGGGLRMTAAGYALHPGVSDRGSDAGAAAYGAAAAWACGVAGATYVDLRDAYDPYRDVGADQTHPTAAGQARIAAAFAAQLRGRRVWLPEL